ncbi:J domain-containing protein isoform X1 [Ctenocephalides felis]|uniref:J domain-containing protein isoform X1 n=1 Tax=Ctenocephalides felis TaxID=7515 RepID=UPI000E6E16B5|nr:J domain-containing protein isoform X1 [Ctenocephalides felis]
MGSPGTVDDILNFKKDDEDDLYKLLGCDENSTVEQITAEYKVLALQYHPDKNDGDKDAEVKFQKLKYAKETLCDPERRSNYDKWRNSGIAISYKQWLGMKEHVHQSMHWSTPKTKDRMLPEAGTGLGVNAPTAALRRASEGGAALHYGNRPAHWGNEPPNEIAAKFRNYEI